MPSRVGHLDAAFRSPDGVGSHKITDFGAESSRPISLLSTLRPHQSPNAGARLATSLPATALTGLDFHQLDFVKEFHHVMS